MKSFLIRLLNLFYPDYLYASKSYSQDGEDMILKAFYEGKKGYKGFYVDIGAHHPYRFSNTAYFYGKGWHGINVEPTPGLFNAFKQKRSKDINLNVGVSDSKETLTFYEFNEPALNSFDKELSLSRESNKYKIITKSEIQVIPLSEILETYLPEKQHIDFFNIDVEGKDINVLKSNDWSRFSPDYILIEGDFDLEKMNENEIYQFLKNKNYTILGRTQRTFLFGRNK